ESSALAVVQETLGALRVVEAVGQESRETDRFVHRSTEGVTARIRLSLMEGRYGVLVGLTSALGTAAVLFIGVRHVVEGVLTVGQLWMALRYLDKLYEPLKTISKKAAGIQSYLASAERAFALLDEQPEVPERPHARPVTRAAGAVEFRGVSFAYGPDRPVLQDVSFAIAPGTRLGVVGATGAGKTTLISLLTRFYEPTSAVDAETEAVILGAMRHLMRGRTVLVISHRPSTLERCAELLVLESGRVVTDTIRSATSAQPPVVAAAIGGRRSQLKSHPAIRARCALYPQVQPVSITPLPVPKRKSSVYRLEGAGQDGSPVNAKRWPRSVAPVGRTVYEDILARLTLPSLRYYGFVDEPDAASGWLFMEEARGPDYCNPLPEHRARAGRWLGLLHAGAAGAAAGGRLPDGGPGRY